MIVTAPVVNACTPVMIRSSPDTLAVAKRVAFELAVILSRSPSGSEKAWEMRRYRKVSPCWTVPSVRRCETTGALLPGLAPLTSKLISAVRPPGSRAVTVILAAPVVNACTAVIVSVLPEIDARTKSVWFERAL